MEIVLEGERRKGQDVRDKLDFDLENERRTRIDFENKLIRCKEEIQKKEVLLSELDFKVNDLTNENDTIRQENDGLRMELDRMNDYYTNSQRELEEKLIENSRKMMSMEQGFRDQVASLREQSVEELDRATSDFETRIKGLEDKTRGLLAAKNQAEDEVRRLTELVKRTRMEAEEHTKEVVIRVQEDEYRKYMANLKALESKMRASEEAREVLSRKTQEQTKQLQELTRRYDDNELEYQNELARFKQDKNDLENQIRQADIMIGKYRSEISSKDNMCSRLEAELIEMQKVIQSQKDRSRGEVENVLREVGNEKRYLEDQREQLAKKVAQLENLMKQKDSEVSYIKTDYDRLCNMLHNNISKTISQTIREKPYNEPVAGKGRGQTAGGFGGSGYSPMIKKYD